MKTDSREGGMGGLARCCRKRKRNGNRNGGAVTLKRMNEWKNEKNKKETERKETERKEARVTAAKETLK